MKRPWMPIYWTDFIADTQHLSAEETGAYLLLIGHYWLRGHLPGEDEKLARVTKLTMPAWLAIKPTIQEFFHDGWKHKRIDFELTEAERISNAGRTGGLASAKARREAKTKQKQTTSGPSGNGGGNDIGNDRPTIVQRSSNDTGNDPPTKTQPPQPPPQDNKTRGPRSSIEDTEPWQIAKEIAQLCGPYEEQKFERGAWGGAVGVVELWRTQWSRNLIVSSVKRQLSTRKARRIETITFFENGIGEDAARMRAIREKSTQPMACSNGQAPEHSSEGWKQHRDQARADVAEFRKHVEQLDDERRQEVGGPLVEVGPHPGPHH